MLVLLTGGTGFVGSHAADALLAAGHEVRLLARSRAKVERVFAARPAAPGEVVEGDVTDPASVAKALAGADAVVHAAGVVAMVAHRANEVRDTNLRAVELVVGGAAERGVGSIVHVSSLGALFRPGRPISADSPPTDARSAYARSKAQSEAFVRRLQAEGAPVRTLYPPAVLGPDDPGESEGMDALRVFLCRTMVDTSSGFAMADVRDLAALVARLVAPATPPGRYLVAGHYHAWPDLIALLDELTGRRVRRIPVSGALLRALGRVGDAIKRVWDFDFPLTGEAMDFATQWTGVAPCPATDALGVRLRDPRDTYRDAIRWLHRAGHLSAAQAGRLAG